VQHDYLLLQMLGLQVHHVKIDATFGEAIQSKELAEMPDQAKYSLQMTLAKGGR
jgi:hypothetical protein